MSRTDCRRPRRGAPLRAGILALVALPLLGGCDDESLLPPDPADPLFARYVALGNSITAGFQSAGILDSTQVRAYPVFLAERMETDFVVPSLAFPGCPPPLVNVFTGLELDEAAGIPVDVACALRSEPIPDVIHNVAVPGAQVLDILDNLGDGDPSESSANALTTFILGGRTQMEAAADARPTFASMWIGNNDVLGAALSGDATRVTPIAEFQARYGETLDSLENLGIDGGLLIAVGNVTSIPNLSPGAAWWQAEQMGALPPTYDVADNCAPAAFGGVGESTLVPFAYGFGVLFAQAAAGTPVTLDCVNDPPVLTGPEIVQISTAVASYNNFIQNEAGARGLAFFNPNPIRDSLRAEGEIPFFPNTQGVAAQEEPFGPWFSKDGVHPSTAAHLLLAARMAEAIDAEYGTGLAAGTP